MVGSTLVELRDYVETLAAPDGAYLVRCGRTGHRPVPVSELRFGSRATARSAAHAAEQYRTTLRRYDPHGPCYDLIVCQEAEPSGSGAEPSTQSPPEPQTPTARTLSDPVVTGTTSDRRRSELVEFCHSAAAAVFETLSTVGYGGVETAIMDAYLELAETIPDPDNLCLCLLESTARELDTMLCPAEQADVLAGAASRLPSRDATDRPVSAALSLLEKYGLFGSYVRLPWSVELDDGTRSVVLRLSKYALAPQNGRLPVVPIVLELYRHRLEWRPSSLRVTETDDGWRITLVMARDAEPSGLASAPIDCEA